MTAYLDLAICLGGRTEEEGGAFKAGPYVQVKDILVFQLRNE